MQLARAVTNIISSLNHKKTHNIIFKASGGLNDCAIFETNFRYYMQPMQNHVFKNPSSRTALTLLEPFFNDNTYALSVTNDLNDNTPQDSLYRHVNNVVVFNQMRPPNMKREDYIISSQKNANRTKLFMNKHIAESWGDMPNSTVINYGVPLDLLTTDDIKQTTDLLVHDTSLLGKQIAGAAQQKGLTVEVVQQFTSFEEFSEKVKNCKVYLDTTINGNYECLCAVALGAKVIGTGSCKMTTPQIMIENNGANILPKIEELLTQDRPDIEEGRKFLDENYNMGKFQEAVTELFNTKIQEAYIA
jgi:prophage maintenance system killer protein